MRCWSHVLRLSMWSTNMSSCEDQTCYNNFLEKFLPRIGIRTTGAFLQKLLKPPKTPNEWKVAIIRKHSPISTMQQKLANGQSCCAANGKDATSLATVLFCKTAKLQSPRQSSWCHTKLRRGIVRLKTFFFRNV